MLPINALLFEQCDPVACASAILIYSRRGSRLNLKMNLHRRDSTPIGITHPVDLGPTEPGKTYETTFSFDPSLFGEGQYFFYLDLFEGVVGQGVCLDKPNVEFSFEVTGSDLLVPQWHTAWGPIHFKPVEITEQKEV